MSLIRTRLSVMMFLQFFIWGAWLPLVFGYLPDLGFNDLQQWLVLACFNVAAIVAMFFSTQFADRNFAAEKFVAFSHLIGGLAILGLGFTTSFWPFFILMLIHCVFYVPTISITNSIAFANVKDPQKDFGLVRLWGTIGWIAASWPFVLILVDWSRVPGFGSVPALEWLGAVLGTPKTGAPLVKATSYTFVASGLASLALAAWSLALPHTPPKPAVKGESQFAWLEAAKLLQIPFMLVLFVVTFIDATVHQFYFYWTARYLTSIGVASNWVMPAMSVGQFAEIGTMAVLGVFLKRLGWRWTMTIGILGHAIRFAVFAFFPFPAPAIAVQILHGVCYAFFFATVYIFVDEFFPKDVRSSAQGLFNLLILGIGPLLGNYLGPIVGDMSKAAGVTAAVVTDGGRQEVVVRGVVRDPRVQPLDLLDIRIAEPGKEPYQRQVALTAERTFEVVLGTPVKGTYSVSALLPTGTGTEKEELRVPPLTIGDIDPGNLPQVQASKIDYRRLFLWPSGTALFAAILLLLFFHPPATGANDEKRPGALPH